MYNEYDSLNLDGMLTHAVKINLSIKKKDIFYIRVYIIFLYFL